MVRLVIPQALERGPAIRSGILATCTDPALSIPNRCHLISMGCSLPSAYRLAGHRCQPASRGKSRQSRAGRTDMGAGLCSRRLCVPSLHAAGAMTHCASGMFHSLVSSTLCACTCYAVNDTLDPGTPLDRLCCLHVQEVHYLTRLSRKQH